MNTTEHTGPEVGAIVMMGSGHGPKFPMEYRGRGLYVHTLAPSERLARTIAWYAAQDEEA